MEDFIKLIHNDKSIIETRLNKVYAYNNEFEKKIFICNNNIKNII